MSVICWSSTELPAYQCCSRRGCTVPALQQGGIPLGVQLCGRAAAGAPGVLGHGLLLPALYSTTFAHQLCSCCGTLSNSVRRLLTWPTSPYTVGLLYTLTGHVGEQRRTMAFYEAGGVDELLQLVQQWRESSANPVRPPTGPSTATPSHSSSTC